MAIGAKKLKVSGIVCPVFESWQCSVLEIALRKRPGIPLETLRVFSEPQDNPDKVRESA